MSFGYFFKAALGNKYTIFSQGTNVTKAIQYFYLEKLKNRKPKQQQPKKKKKPSINQKEVNIQLSPKEKQNPFPVSHLARILGMMFYIGTI